MTQLSRRRRSKILAEDLKTKHELFSTFKQLLQTSNSDLLYSSGFQSPVCSQSSPFIFPQNFQAVAVPNYPKDFFTTKTTRILAKGFLFF